jgi:NitT/TauT family transport system permease protein
MATTSLETDLVTPQPQRLPGWLRKTLVFFAILIALCLLWEGYKVIGAATDNKIPFTDIPLPVRSDDNSMPHLASIVGALFQPAQRGSDTTLLSILIQAALATWREAIVGFLIGSLVGFLLGAMFGRWMLLERGLMPYVVASQTVPLLAIAPMIVIWGSQLGWDTWIAVTIISSYLTFFPVAINTLRGLRSPDPTSVELMRSYASSEWQTLWKLRVPAALPYIFTALKISATASVIGAIVGELPSGIATGLGRSLLTFSYYYTTGPEKLYAAIIIAALLGITFTVIIILLERIVVPAQRRLSE